MQPFDAYPHGGQQLFGLELHWSNCRRGYGLEVMHRTGQTSCAYCGLDFAASYENWLLLAVDHVIPKSECDRLGLNKYRDDLINLVLACSGCNGFQNKFRTGEAPREYWPVTDFVELRDRVFTERLKAVKDRREDEKTFFYSKPWLR